MDATRDEAKRRRRRKKTEDSEYLLLLSLQPLLFRFCPSSQLHHFSPGNLFNFMCLFSLSWIELGFGGKEFRGLAVSSPNIVVAPVIFHITLLPPGVGWLLPQRHLVQLIAGQGDDGLVHLRHRQGGNGVSPASCCRNASFSAATLFYRRLLIQVCPSSLSLYLPNPISIS